MDYWGNPVVVYGSGGTSGRVIRALREEPGLGYFPVGVFDDRPELWGDYVEGVRVLGSLEQSAPAAPVAVLVGSGIPPDRVAELLEGPLSCYKQAVVIPDLFDIPSLWVKSRNLAGILGLEITSNLLDPLSKFLKRSMDLLVLLGTAPLWGPTYLLVAGLIRLDGGGSPLFFQDRVGKNDRTFKMPKFRTMHRDADDLLDRLLDEDEELRAEWLASFKLRRDPRVTRLGSFLRTWSLDELPQLISVLRGDMSLVGPRPLPHYHLMKLQPHTQKLRTRVRPGMTGQWQVSGRSDAGSLTMERWDAFYVRNWSVWLDIVILVRTLGTVIRGSGAY
jgi:Undecaprenyl-phosphate galactose phosphotransferase WbaP